MTIAIHQPEYLPWPGFFNKMLGCDTYVVLDTVEFSRGGFQNRNRIKLRGKAKWLTIPISGSTMIPINEIKIDNSKTWQRTHLDTLKQAYGKSRFFGELADFLNDIYARPFEKLVDANLAVIKYFMNFFGIKRNLVLSSEINPGGRRTDLLIDICRKLGADAYLSGIGGKNYLERDKFQEAEIKLMFQNFTPTQYPQSDGEFIPYLSVLDLIFNCGKEQALKLIS